MSVIHFFISIPNIQWACFTALLATASCIALLRPIAGRIGLLDIPDHRKHHLDNTPLIGGLAVYAGMMLSLLIFIPLENNIIYLLATASLVMLTGLLDDIRDLGVKIRVLVQLAAILIMINGSGLYISSLGDLFGFGEIQLGLWGVPFTVVAVIGVINAFNLIDGIDGLAGGMTLVAILSILGFEALTGNYRGLEYLVLLCMALMPFLLVNLGLFGKRKIFLGDAGSMFLGYVMAWSLISLSQGENRAIEPINALWCVAIPIIDTLGVMVRRIRKGQSPFLPDREHLHHIFMRAGLSDRRTLFIILTAAAVISSLGILLARFAPAISFYIFSSLFVLYSYLAISRAWRLQKLMKSF